MPAKKAKRPANEDTRTIVLSMKGTDEFRGWLNELALHCHTTAVNVMELALVEYARRVKFPKNAPRRTAGRGTG